MTCSDSQMIKGACGGLPVTYDRQSAEKTIINKDELWKADTETFDNKIGFLTNLSTSAFSLLANFKEGTPEHNALVSRLKDAVCSQSKQIDKAKGIKIDKIPEWWTKFQTYKNDDDEETKSRIKFYNSILLDKRPYFMRYLYSKFEREYKKYNKIYNLFCMNNFGLTLEEFISKENKNEKEKKYFDYYYRYNHLLDSPSIMNQVCHYMEDSVKELKDISKEETFDFQVDKQKMKQMELVYKRWKELRAKYGKDDENMIPSIIENEILDISTNGKEIAMLALNASSGFGLTTLGKYTEELFYKKTVQIPVLDKNGSIEFDSQRYSLLSLNLEERE